MVQQKFASSHQDPLKKLEEKIGQDTTVHKALQTLMESSTSSGAQARTLASPQWDNNPPVNFRKSINLAMISLADFDANNTHHPCVYLSQGIIYVFALVLSQYVSLNIP